MIDILRYEELDSTNNEAKRLIAAARLADNVGSVYGTVIIAEKQSAGRGRRGRSFASPGLGSVYASFVFPPPERPAEQLITALAAVAVCEALEKEAGLKPVIKWVNDILIDGKKVCGILAESVPMAVILGIGVNINVSEDDLPEELRGVAGSVRMSGQERERFLNTLVEAVFRYASSSGTFSSGLLRLGCDVALLRSCYARNDEGDARNDEGDARNDEGGAASLMDEYRARSLLPGKNVLVTKGNEEIPAFTKEIADDGALVVEYEDGSFEELRSVETSVRLL